jgi:hypothetical protein
MDAQLQTYAIGAMNMRSQVGVYGGSEIKFQPKGVGRPYDRSPPLCSS